VPDYLREVYRWAYLTPLATKLLDRQLVVQAILWGNAQRLIDDVLAELRPGDRVFQPAAVYGTFSSQVAARLGPSGRLDVRDIAPVQVALTRRKLAGCRQAHVAAPAAGQYDVVACFFLLHEVPDAVKARIVPALLRLARPGGKVLFVDYHRPRGGHPLRPVMQRIFDWLEPFAHTMWRREVQDFAGALTPRYRWRKTTRFGGLYQVVVAEQT
jgi:SAM-dependent methyltransferase